MADFFAECAKKNTNMPSILSCLLTDGHSSNQPRKMQGMNNRSILNDKPKLKFKMFCKSRSEMMLLNEWFVTKLDRGYKSFKMQTFFMGIEGKMNVRIINDLTLQLKTKAFGEIDFEAEILDDVSVVSQEEIKANLEKIGYAC